MSLSSRISHLREKHTILHRRIEEAERRPGVDELEITALKREKLYLKEEIERLTQIH